MSSGYTFEEAFEAARPGLPGVQGFMEEHGWTWCGGRRGRPRDEGDHVPSVAELEDELRALGRIRGPGETTCGGFVVKRSRSESGAEFWTITFDILGFLSRKATKKEGEED